MREVRVGLGSVREKQWGVVNEWVERGVGYFPVLSCQGLEGGRVGMGEVGVGLGLCQREVLVGIVNE